MKTKIMFIITLVAVMISSCNSTAQNHSATLAGMGGGKATVAQLSADSVLLAAGPGMAITSFRMSTYLKSGNKIELLSQSASLTELMRTAVANAKPGSKIYFEYIKGKDSKGDTVTFKPLGFEIK